VAIIHEGSDTFPWKPPTNEEEPPISVEEPDPSGEEIDPSGEEIDSSGEEPDPLDDIKRDLFPVGTALAPFKSVS